MASSAFASFKYPDFNKISDGLYAKKMTDEEKEDYLKVNAPFVLNRKKFIADLNYSHVSSDLRRCYYEYTADEIYNKLVKDKKIIGKVYGDYKDLMENYKFEKLKLYANASSKELTKDEIKTLLQYSELPSLSPKEKAAAVFYIKSFDYDTKKFFDIREFVSLDKEMIMDLEERKTGKKLSLQEITNILNLNDNDAQMKSETLWQEILFLTSQKIKKALETKAKFNDIDPKTVDGFGLDFEQILALIYQNPDKDSAEIKNILEDPRAHLPDENEAVNTMAMYILKFAPKAEDRVGDIKELEKLLGGSNKAAAVKFQEELTGKKINITTLMEILKASNSGELAPFLTALQKADQYQVPAEYKEQVEKIFALATGNKLLADVPDSEFTDLTAKQIAAIKAKDVEITKRITAEELVAILNANATPVITPKPGENQTQNQPPGAKVDTPAEIMKQVDKHGKFKTDYRNALKDAKISGDQWKQLEAAGKAKQLTLALVKEIMTAKPKNKKGKEDEKDVNYRVDLVMANLENGKLKAGAKKALLKAGITEDQIKKLMAADTLDKDKVAEILASSIIKSDGTSSETKSDDTPFYTSGWFMSISAVLVVGAIGGGVYIMTRKSEETDKTEVTDV